MNRSKLIKTVDNQIYFALFLGLLWSRSILLSYFRGLLLNLPLVSAVADIVVPLIMIVFFLLALGTIVDRLKGVDITFFFVCLVIYAASYLLFEGTRYYHDNFGSQFLIGALPLYFVGVALNHEQQNRILEMLLRISCITVIAFALYRILGGGLSGKFLLYGDMSNAYNLLPHVCLIFYYMVRKPTAARIALFVVGFFMLLLSGSRGPVLCLLLYAVIVLCTSISLKNPKILLAILLLAIVAILFGGLVDLLLDIGYDLAEALGMSTRVFDKYASGEFTSSIGREVIREEVMDALNETPLTGLGIYGDRHIAGGQYAHNFFVEVLAHYGYLIGSVLFLCFFLLLLRAVRYMRMQGDESVKLVLLLLLGCNFKLFVSGSYMNEPFFFLLLGYCVAIVRQKREHEEKLLRTAPNEKRSVIRGRLRP